MTNEEAIKLLEGIVAPDDLEMNIKLQPYYSAMDKAIEALKAQKVGKWIVLKDEYDDIVEAVCSCCDNNGNHKWLFCPNCGARMEGQE